jgi:hypothetical protein
MWFAHFGPRICGGAQHLNNSHLVYHTSNPLIFQLSLTGQKIILSEVWNVAFSCASIPLVVVNF